MGPSRRQQYALIAMTREARQYFQSMNGPMQISLHYMYCVVMKCTIAPSRHATACATVGNATPAVHDVTTGPAPLSLPTGTGAHLCSPQEPLYGYREGIVEKIVSQNICRAAELTLSAHVLRILFWIWRNATKDSCFVLNFSSLSVAKVLLGNERF